MSAEGNADATLAASRGNEVKRHGCWAERIAVLFSVALLIWLAARTDHLQDGFPLTGESPGYYNVLVRAFLAGRTSFEAEPEPRLLSADPQVRAQVLTWQDAAIYEGKHYLYYGVAPAVLVMLPYAVLTGQGMGENVVVLVGVLVGFSFSLAWWRAARRRYFPALGTGLRAASVGTLALGTGCAAMLVRSEFYEIPIAWAYACAMAACWCAWGAWHEANHAARWLAGAGLSLALAVGCRPEYVFSLPAVTLLVWLMKHRWNLDRVRVSRLILAATLPAAVVGMALGGYNYVRFGNFLDTGFSHGANEFFTSGDPLVSGRFVWANLRWYLLTLPSFSPYFPFIYPIAGSFRPPGYHGDEPMHGSALLALLAVISVGALLRLGGRPLRLGGEKTGSMCVPLFLLLVTGVFLCLLGIRANRYGVEMAGPLLLLTLWAAGEAGALRKRRLAGGLLALMGCLMMTNVGIALQQFHRFAEIRPATDAALARIFNAPARLAERLGLISGGPLRLTVMLPKVTRSQSLPLLTAGLPYYADMVYVTLHPDRTAEILLVAQNHGDVRGEPFPYAPDEPAIFEIEMGSLYPPAGGPYFSGFEPYDVGRAKGHVEVRVNTVPRLESWLNFNESPPWSITPVRNDTVYMGEETPRRFSPPPIAVERVKQPPERRNLLASGRNGVWRLAVNLPPAPWAQPLPLLASGRTGAGNLLFVTSPAKGVIRFGLDYWGIGTDASPDINVGAGSSHRLELFVGPAIPAETLKTAPLASGQAAALHIWLDGNLVWSARIRAHFGTYDRLAIGANPQGFGSAGAYFPGELQALPINQAAVNSILQALPAVP